MNSLKIFLADDHQLVANGIASLLKEIDFVSSVSIFSNGKELTQALKAEIPDFILLDVEMPIFNGIQTIELISNLYPSIPCCMLSMVNDKTIIEKCIELGASGFLNKDCSTHELHEAISSIQKGEIYYSKEALKSLCGLKKPMSENQNLFEISDRELEVLALLCDGSSPKEIADKLFLSHRTVETHKNNIMKKFEVNSVTKLISIALKNKIV